MGGMIKRKFAHRESPATCSHTCRTCLKQFRYDEEYDADDEREVHQRKPVSSWRAGGLKVWEVYESDDEWEPRRQIRKSELTVSQREKGAALAQPDPCGPLTADEDDLLSLDLLITMDIDGWGPGPLPDNLDMDRKADDVPKL